MVQHQPPSTLTANHCAATMHANEVLGATAGILQYEEVHAPLSIKNPSILTTALTLSQRKLSRQTPRDSRQRENGRGGRSTGDDMEGDDKDRMAGRE